MFDIEDKIKTREQMDVISSQLRARGKVLVFTNGCFDILHKGHLTYLREARRSGDALVIGLNSDESVRRLKGESRPLNHEQERALMLAALEFVDYVVIFPEDDPRELLSVIRPGLLVKGGDYRIEDILGREYADRTITIPFVDGFSTTGIIQRMTSCAD